VSDYAQALLNQEGHTVSDLSYVEAVVLGAFQGVTELFPVSSLGHSILVPALVGGLKIPDLFGPLGEHIHGQVLIGSLASFVTAYLAVRFLTRYFETRTLTPFAIYCTVSGAASLTWLMLR
jgi:undecaprenyl pyrophosphate phosphatase UppP